MLDKVKNEYEKTCDYFMVEPTDEKRSQSDKLFIEFQKIGNDIYKIENTKSKHTVEYLKHAKEFKNT